LTPATCALKLAKDILSASAIGVPCLVHRARKASFCCFGRATMSPFLFACCLVIVE